MTDRETTERIYIEPLTPEIVEKVIAKERPDALLPTMGGQTALNVAVELARSGALDKYNVDLIGAKLSAIEMAEDPQMLKAGAGTAARAKLGAPRMERSFP
jgi:carbamoyl-phosphate synthase large subunit